MTPFPSFKMLPQEGCGAGTPAPRKLRAASVMMAEAKTKVTCTMMGEMMLGAICRQMIRILEAPRQRMASI